MTENLDTTAITGELRTLNSSVQKLTEIQEAIRKKQNELAELGRQQRDLANQQTHLQSQILSAQQAGLETQKQTLLIQEKQLKEQQQQTINTSIIAANSQIETLRRQEEEERRKRQQFLKNTIFPIEELERATLSQSDELIKLLMLQELKRVVNKYNVFPDEFEEIEDKKYASTVLKTLEQDFQKTESILTQADREDIRIWQETPELLATSRTEIASAKQRSQRVAEELARSQNRLSMLRGKKVPDPRKLRTITLASRSLLIFAVIGLLAFALTTSMQLVPWPQISLSVSLICLALGITLVVVRRRMDVESQIQRINTEIQSHHQELKQLSDRIPLVEAEERRLSGEIEQTLTRHPGLRNFPRNLPA
jgi:hypothetical protein